MYLGLALLPSPADPLPTSRLNADGIPVLDLAPGVGGYAVVQLDPGDPDAAQAYLAALIEAATLLVDRIQRRQERCCDSHTADDCCCRECPQGYDPPAQRRQETQAVRT